MGTLYLVRHGQASLGAADYDRLSALGERQCQALGDWLQARGLRFDAVLRGTLRRHEQSLAAIARGYGALPPALPCPGLDEYDSAALITAAQPVAPEPPTTPEAYRAHFRALRSALARWMAGEIEPAGMPNWPAFVGAVTAALEQARRLHAGPVLVVSSGGPIAAAVGQLLGATPAATVELNLRIRNSAVTELLATSRGLALLSFNHLPHLDGAERAGWITYA